MENASTMPIRKTIRSMLTVGRYCLSSGRTAEVVELVRANPRKIGQLLECLWDKELSVAMRAATALERLTRFSRLSPDPVRLSILKTLERSWKAPLIGLLIEATENKQRWCLAAMVPRIKLTVSECQRVAEILQSFLEDRSSVLKTCALQGLADLARQDGSLLPEVIDLLRIHSRSGTPAMRARGRMLLKQLESTRTKRFSEFVMDGDPIGRSLRR